MNSFQLFKRFRFFSLLTVFAVLLMQTSALSQGEAAQGEGGNNNLYSNEKYMFAIELPEGFSAWGEEATKEFFDKSRKERDMPEEFKEQSLDDLPTLKTIFQPSGPNISNESIIIHAGIPVVNSLEEFETTYTPADMDCVTLSKETITVNYRTCYLIDREFDQQGLRFRQMMAFIQGIGPAGYLINFNAIAVDFNAYREKYMKCLKTFKVQPPKTVPPELKQAKYSKKVQNPNDQKPAWRSVEVIGSFIIVAILVIWFMLKRLSAGAAEQNVAALPGQTPVKEDAPPVEPPSDSASDNDGGD